MFENVLLFSFYAYAGYVKDGIYIHPHLSSFYALPEGKNGVDDLLMPGDFVCRDKGITVVETLDAQVIQFTTFH